MFTCEKIRNNVTSITAPGGVRAFLIEGTREAVLVDTCCGVGNLKERLEKRWDEFDSVWFSHGDVEGPKSVIHTVLDVCADIVARNDDAIETDFFGEKGLIAKKMGENGRVDGKIGNVVYGLDNIKGAVSSGLLL